MKTRVFKGEGSIIYLGTIIMAMGINNKNGVNPRLNKQLLGKWPDRCSCCVRLWCNVVVLENSVVALLIMIRMQAQSSPQPLPFTVFVRI